MLQKKTFYFREFCVVNVSFIVLKNLLQMNLNHLTTF